MEPDPPPPDAILAELTDEQRAWALHAEALWARAHAIAAGHPGMDAGDVYHALRCLELSLASGFDEG